jgi:hypothetical protein
MTETFERHRSRVEIDGEARRARLALERNGVTFAGSYRLLPKKSESTCNDTGPIGVVLNGGPAVQTGDADTMLAAGLQLPMARHRS